MRLTRIGFATAAALSAILALGACSSTQHSTTTHSRPSVTSSASPSDIASAPSRDTSGNIVHVDCKLTDPSTVTAVLGRPYTESPSLDASQCAFVSQPATDAVILGTNTQSQSDFEASMQDLRSTDPNTLGWIYRPLLLGAKITPIDTANTALQSKAKSGYLATTSVDGLNFGLFWINDGHTSVNLEYRSRNPFDQAKAYELLAHVLDNLRAGYKK